MLPVLSYWLIYDYNLIFKSYKYNKFYHKNSRTVTFFVNLNFCDNFGKECDAGSNMYGRH